MKDDKSIEWHWQFLVILLKEVCKQRNITQEELAELTGLKQQSISRIFLLKFSPNLKTYMTIANALELNVFFEPRDSKSDISIAFEKVMQEIGRRPDSMPKN